MLQDQDFNMPYIPSIFDKQELVNKLIEIVKPQVKQAQAPADTNVIKSLARKLADKLSTTSAVNLDKSGVGLYMRDLQSLDSLISFLNINGVKFGDKFIVQPDYNKLTPEEKSLYAPFKWSGGIDAMPLGTTAAVYKEGLVGYLKTLQQKATDLGGASGQLLGTMISKLADSANTTLKTKIDSESLKSPVPAKDTAQPVLLDTIPLDSVNDTLNVDNPLSPGRDQGSITITPKDLKSKMDFDNFARKIKVNKSGKIYDYDKNTVDTFFCDIINVLHARAASYAYRRGVYLDKAYLKLITDLAGEYQCSLKSTPVPQAVPIPGAGPGPAGTPGNMNLIPAILQELASLQPFNSQNISFTEIINFLDKYSSLANDPNVTSTANEVKKYINNFQSLLGMPTDTIQMYNLTTGQFKSWLKNPASAQIAVGNLYDIIHYAGALYQRMVTSLQTIARDPHQLPPAVYRAMQQQITPGGPQLTNISTLNQLRYNLQQEWQQK